MKNITIIGAVMLTAGCSALDFHEVRAGFEASDFEAEVPGLDGDGAVVGGRIEVTNRVSDTLSVGLSLGAADGDIGDTEVQTYDVGGTIRGYADIEGPLRPYLEARLGYLRTELDSPFFGSGHADALKTGLGLGAELRLGDGGAFLFGQVNYEAGFSSQDYWTHGPSVTLGGGFTF